MTRQSQIDIVRGSNNNILSVGATMTRQSQIDLVQGTNNITYRLWEWR